MRIVFGAALAAFGFVAAAQAQPMTAGSDDVAVQCIVGAYRFHEKHPGEALPDSCSKIPGIQTGDVATRILGSWDDFRVEATGPGGARNVASSRGGPMTQPSSRMRMSEKVCTPDKTYCCVWDDDKHPPRCGINTGGPL
jgi:hypothetical protein